MQATIANEFSETRPQAIAMFCVLLASYAVNAMDRQVFPLVAPDVRHEFGFSLAAIGLLSTIFTLGMALAGLPTGYLLTRFSRKAVLQLGIAIFSTGTILTIVSVGLPDMFAYRALTGIGEAMQLTVLLSIAANYFTRHPAVAIGAVNFSFGLGAIAGPILGAVLLGTQRHWRVPLSVFGILGFVAIGLVAFAVRPWFTETKPNAGAFAASIPAPSLLNRNTILLTLMSLIAGLVIYGYLGMYPTFLREALHFSPKAAGAVMGSNGLGAIASIAGGWLGDRFSPRFLMSLSFLTAALVGYLLFHGPNGLSACVALSFTWGVVVSGVIYVNLAGYYVKAVPGRLASRASGIFVTSLYGSAAAAGYLMGGLATRLGWVFAGDIQFSLLATVAAILALGLRPSEMSV